MYRKKGAVIPGISVVIVQIGQQAITTSAQQSQLQANSVTNASAKIGIANVGSDRKVHNPNGLECKNGRFAREI
jgi:hypothetical protein